MPPICQSAYTEEMAAEICARISNGRSLRSVCRDEDMPAQATVFKWLAAQPSFVEQYARAREAQADAIFDEILDIADDSGLDTSIGADGQVRVDGEAIARARLRVDARKWMAGKMAPKKYGDKLNLEGTLTVTHEDALSQLK